MSKTIPALLLFALLPAFSGASARKAPSLDFIRPSEDGTHFVREDSGERFIAWGVNYDHDRSGRLLEDYWDEEWGAVEEDFQEIKALGANTVRIHLQTGKFMRSPRKPDGAALRRLARLVRLAERTGLYLDLTGLGCYHKQDVPEWYASMSEADRWCVQARFWEAVAKTCAQSPSIFCYDLMNEPVVPGGKNIETDWLAGEFGGKYFVQRIALDARGRTSREIARAWVEKLAGAIRKHDKRHLITVGAIPWVYSFPGAQPLFYSKEVGESLDFVSVHFYPKAGDAAGALKALEAYEIGKPLVIEELFPLQCSLEDLDAFIEGSRSIADGWIGFYWGETIDELDRENLDLAGAITKAWLEYFRDKGPAMVNTSGQ